MTTTLNTTNRGDLTTSNADRNALDSDHPARLQQLARTYDGANDRPSERNTESYAYPATARANRFQDIDDPAALLESLASFDKVTASSEAPVSTDQFASLLQAAATAGAAQSDQNQRRDSQSSPSEQYIFPQIGRVKSVKRKRDEEPPQEFGLVSSSVYKRRKEEEAEELEEEDEIAREQEIWGPEDHNSPSTFEYHTTAAAVAEDARNAGVHSAAALFRRPSAASKKYTRPPMSKLFTSLELTPEQFLHLQAAAKSYMLDEQHPDRSDCVGGRGRGDTDMTKLKLFACVKAFLEDEGWGERCFGESAPGAATRKLKYPQMKNKIISLITPLLRRMVTNERQRLYANAIRKQNPKPGKKRGSTGTPQPNSQPASTSSSPAVLKSQLASSPQHFEHSTIDPRLDQSHYALDPISPPQSNQDDSTVHPDATHQGAVRYHVNLLHEGQRVRKLMLTPKSCPEFSSLVQHVRDIANDEALPAPNSIQVLGINGLVAVIDQASWTDAIEAVRQNEWMDGEVRIIAQAII